MTLATGLFSRGMRALGALTVAAACALGTGARAEDIDLFEPFTPPGNDPNILIILDNSSNWSSSIGPNTCNTNSTKFDMEMCALSDLVGSLNIDVRIGLMLINEKADPLGGYVRYAVRDMGSSSAQRITNRTALVNMLKNFNMSGTGADATSSAQPAGWLMHEAWMYFFAQTIDETTPGNGGGWTIDTVAKNGAKRRDWNGNGNPAQTGPTDVRSAKVYGADQAAAAFISQNSRTYVSPIKSACQKNIIIYIGNGDPGGESTTPSISAKLTSIGGDATIIKNLAGSTLHASYADEYARFLWDKKGVHTYGIAVWAPQSGGLPSASDQKMRDLLQSAANVGNGKFFDAKDATAFRKALADILNEIQAVNSVFVSASLPVSVNTQGTYLNQVYMGMFRPDRSPRWLGNLKEYKILQNATTGALYLADSKNNATVNPTTGFITPSAQSFWTADNTYWAKKSPTKPSDLPDGDIVEKGAAGEQLRTKILTAQDPRNMFTCPMNADCPKGPLSVKFTTANVTGVEAQFGVTAAQLPAMVNWIRGQDNVNGTPCNNLVAPCTWTSHSTEVGPGWPTTARPSVHGDVLHSRPVVLNYTTLGPHIFYGSGDGTLRGTKGGRALTDGNELWSFVAPEFYGKFKRLRDAAPEVKFPTSVVADPLNPPLPKDYFFDGAIGAYQSPDLSKAYIFATARRGGRFIYGFEVSDPANPSVLWKLSPALGGDFTELGQSWSEPKAFKVKASTDPVIMFGAGYATTEDTNPAGVATMGRGVFVVNAKTGDLIRFFQTSNDGFKITSPVPSDVAVIDHDFDTYADRAYVGDMGGNIWRMDIDDADPSQWKMYKFASLGPNRKFFFRPDVVISASFDLVLVGSGNREDPTNTTTTDNFYLLKDPKTGKDGSGQVPILVTDLGAPGTDITAKKGWVRDLRVGEKVVNAPLSIGGIVYFSTNRPTPLAVDPTTCSPNLGEARAYALDFLTGLSGRKPGSNDPDDVSTKLTGGGLPPSPVGGVVQLDDGKLVDFVIGSGAGGSAISPEQPKRDIPKVRKKLYWNTNTDK